MTTQELVVERCPWAIRYGTTLATRCMHPPHSAMQRHEGRGLEKFPYQRIEWLAGDRREFRSPHEHVHSFEDDGERVTEIGELYREGQ